MTIQQQSWKVQMQSKSLKSQRQHVFVIRAEQGVVTVLHPVTIECFKQKTGTEEKGSNIHNAASKWSLWMLRQKQTAFVLMHMIDIITVTCSNAALKEWNSEPTKIYTTVFYMQSKLQCDGCLTMCVVQKPFVTNAVLKKKALCLFKHVLYKAGNCLPSSWFAFLHICQTMTISNQ